MGVHPKLRDRSRSPSSSGTGSGQQPQLKRRTELVGLVDNLFRVNSIQRADRQVAPKKAPGQEGQILDLQSNVYGINLPEAHVYRYEIQFFAKFGDKEVELTKPTKSEFKTMQRRALCRDIFQVLLKHNSEFFHQDRHEVYYDCQNVVYTIHRIPTMKKEPTFAIKLQAKNLGEDAEFLGGAEKVIAMIRKDEKFKLRLDQLSFLQEGNLNPDNSHQQFLQVLINQHVAFTPEEHTNFGTGLSYLVHPEEHGFTEKDCMSLEGGKRLRVGCEKAVHYVEGAGGFGNACAALILDTKKTAFHESMTLVKKMELTLHNVDKHAPIARRDVAKLNEALKGLYVKTRHTERERSFPIHGFVEANAEEQKFNTGDSAYITIAEYFEKRHGLKLRYPRLPVVTVFERGSVSYFPMEVLRVCQDQRVLTSQLTPAQIAQTIRACAVSPAKCANQNKATLNSLELKNNPYLENAKVEVVSKPMNLRARVIPQPIVSYGDPRNIQSLINFRPENGMWKTGRGRPVFVEPSGVKRWAIVLIAETQRGSIDDHTLQKFIDVFTRECCNKGMAIHEPEAIRRIRADTDMLENVLIEYIKHHIKFVMCITDDSVKDLHKMLKLKEREFSLVTQDVRASTVLAVALKGRWATLENIVMKTNVKLGGMNYEIRHQSGSDLPIGDRCMIVGFAVSHASVSNIKKITAKSSTVVGFAANVKNRRDDFVGDFVCQEPRREEKYACIMKVMANLVRRFARARSFYPTDVVIYRNGSSEGDYGHILEYEIPMIERAIHAAGAVDAQVTMIIPQKAHNVRLLMRDLDPTAKITHQNIPSGTVVDEGLVHPVLSEFYLNSHAGIAGTVKTPRYTVLYDHNSFSMDELQKLTHSLCFGFQIVNLATSLPAPVMIASRYADRGRNLLAASDGGWIDEKTKDDVNYEDVTNKLAYTSTKLENIRVNA